VKTKKLQSCSVQADVTGRFIYRSSVTVTGKDGKTYNDNIKYFLFNRNSSYQAYSIAGVLLSREGGFRINVIELKN